MKGDMRTNGVRAEGDIVSIVIQTVLAQKEHSSLYVRETVALGALIIMTQNYSSLSEGEIKSLKNLFVEGLHDSKPEGTLTLNSNCNINSYEL